MYRGTASSTAATEVGTVRDVTITTDPQKAPTTTRGTAGTPPVETEGVVSIKWSCDWTMVNDTSDASLTAFRTAAAAGSPIALRLKDYSAGKGFDGDVTLSCKEGQPLAGEQTFDFTATPTKKSGRAPLVYS